MATPSPSPGPQPVENGFRYDTFTTGDNANRFQSQTRQTESSSPAGTAPQPKPTTRLIAPDLQRGLLMALMAMDHLAMGLHTWGHGTNIEGETDGVIVREWNFPVAYAVRSLTHLCAPGFMFLLGMGVVLLSGSRTKMGWSTSRLLRYYNLRTMVLTGVVVMMGLVMSLGQVWFLNAVLFALAVHYFLSGALWLIVNKTEAWLAQRLEVCLLMVDKRARVSHGEDDDGEEEGQSLLRGSSHTVRETERSVRAASISWHFHNTILLGLSIITIWWNIWLSPNHGHCKLETSTSQASPAWDIPPPPADGHPTNIFLRIWFWNVISRRVMSNFPPLAWISFAILGLIYGRVLSARKWQRLSLSLGHIAAGALFAILFILTRILRFGNLSEECLRTPDQDANPNLNPYVVSVASFFYIVKYPPDVAFFAYSMAGNLFLLGIFNSIPTAFAKRFLTILLDYGTSSLFFYVLHSFVILSPLANFVKDRFGHDTGTPDMMNPGSSKGITSLFAYFTIWLLLMLIMWPACRYFTRFKNTKHPDSLWRVF